MRIFEPVPAVVKIERFTRRPTSVAVAVFVFRVTESLMAVPLLLLAVTV